VLKEERHVKIDIVLNRLNARTQATLNIITSVIGAIVFLVVAWYGLQVTLESLQTGYRLDTPLRTHRFLIVAVIPVGSFLFSVRFLRRAYGYLVMRRIAPADGEQSYQGKARAS
jgi:TRAP-type C4-dicarboxylate transport system permease small subunit